MPNDNAITLPDGSTRPLNFVPSPPQITDHVWFPPNGASPAVVGNGPFNNEVFCNSTDDQGQQGSCSAQGSTGLFEFTAAAHAQPVTEISRAWVYAKARIEDGNTGLTDSGSYARTVAKVLSRGAPREDLMPYDQHVFNLMPTAQAEADAPSRKLLQYARPLQNQAALTSMFSMQQGMIGGYPIYESFERAETMRTGLIPVPQAGERLLGYHLTFFYDCDANYVYTQNSWGTGIGMHGSGRFAMPWQLVLNPNWLTDLWTFITVEQGVVPQPTPPAPDELAKLYADILRILGPIDGVGIHFQHGQNWPLAIQAPAGAQAALPGHTAGDVV